ncbi:MAG TPA: methylmalonyl-CoA mutase family protein [Cyclobacteriaceae bacterium]|nr:methylmalonyl-CoA mutase family protein [Cyclobacteriaceae bacterium]HQQ97042.1 methylmalonyl-CoA mutase family protein [Cyclobacteriaceae bacterium]
MSGSFPALDQFPDSGLPEWEKAASEELKGGNPWEKLGWKQEGVEIKPYLDASQSTAPPPLLIPSGDLYRGPRAWHNMPAVYADNPATANQQALESLREGADGVCFVLPHAVSWEDLLQGIDWSICSLCFVSESAVNIATTLTQYIHKHYKGISLQGAWFSRTSQTVTGLTSGIVFPASPSPIDMLTQGFTTLMQKEGGLHGISLTLGTDFFLEIAKLRSVRTLHTQLLDQLNQNQSLILHARSQFVPSPEYDPHSTMLRHTTTAMAAIMGGCDMLTLEEDPTYRPMSRRIARQVSNLLREESQFGRVADPVAGSYLVEDLTRQITNAVWANLKPMLKR